MTDMLDEELSMMYEEEKAPKVLDAAVFSQPIKNIRVRRPIALAPEDTVEKAIEEMNQHGVGCVLIIEKKSLVGIFTERDVLKKIAGRKKAEKLKLREAMTPKVEGLQADDSIAYVLNTMHVGGYRHVPIMNEKGHPVAVISVKDIVGFIIEHFPEDVMNLPPRPIRTTTEREGA